MIDKVGISSVKGSINPPKYVQKEETEKKSHITQSYAKIPQETYKAYYTVSFRGVPPREQESKDVYTAAFEALKNTQPDETATVKEAIDILSPLNLTEKNLLEYLMACSYDSHDENVVINKHALYYAVLLNGGLKDVPNSKIPKVIATSMDNTNQCFSEKTFESLFNAADEIRRTKINSLKRPREDNYTNARKLALIHKSYLSKEIAKILKEPQQAQQTNIDTDSIFDIDLEKEKISFLNALDEAYQNKDITSELYKKMTNSIKSGNYDLKEVYSEHYSMLKECKTLEEAKSLYPEIKIPKIDIDVPKFERILRSRLALEDMDKVGLDILKKIYIEQKPAHLIFVDLENSYPTTYMSMQKAGFDFGKIPTSVVSLMDKTSKLIQNYSGLDEISDRTLEFLIRKNASKESRIWAEYIGITNKYWHPVRAIAHKQKHPLTSYYQTDKLADGYLFYLYKYKNESVPSKNPLEEYADGKPFNAEKKFALERLYFLFRNNYNPEIKSKEFLEFKKNFDEEAIKESITKLERHYKNTFANWFMTQERRDRYEKALENSYRLVFEKLDICKLSQKIKNANIPPLTEQSLSNEEIVDYIAETEDETEQYLQNSFERIKNAIFSSKSNELINLFRSYIGQEYDKIDKENFLNYKDELETGIKEAKVTNPQKLISIFKLNNSYLNYLYQTETDVISFDQYRQGLEEQFKTEYDTIDYAEMNKFLDIKNSYEKILKEENETAERQDYKALIDNKFVKNTNQKDYKTALELINMYDRMPEQLKTKFYTLAKNTDKVSSRIFFEQLKDLSEKVGSWNLDKPEYITMDADKIPQRIVITPTAKQELLEQCGKDIERFDTILNKFYNAGTKRIGKTQGQGVKSLGENTGYAAELKIQGGQAVGSKRLYARHPSEEDLQKYGNVKYVFYTSQKHL